MYDARALSLTPGCDSPATYCTALPQIFGPTWEENSIAIPLVAKFMEKNYKGEWVSRGITAAAFGLMTEGRAVLLMDTFKLQNTVRASAAQTCEPTPPRTRASPCSCKMKSKMKGGGAA